MSRWSRWVQLAPALIAAFPAAHLWMANYDEITWQDALLTLVVFALAGVLVHLAIAALARRRMERSTIAAIASIANAVLFCVVLVAEQLPMRFRYAVLLLGGAAAAAIVWLWRVGGHRPGIARTIVIVTIVCYVPIVMQPFRASAQRAPLRERIRAESSFSDPIAASVAPPGRLPDIYLVILDTYGSADVLASVYGVDDSAFRDSLRALGFSLPVTRANYPITGMALASILNVDYLHSLSTVLDGRETRVWPLYELIEDDRVTSFLERRSYESYFVPSVPWRGTLEHERARLHFPTTEVGAMEGRWLRSRLISVLWPRLLIGNVLRDRVTWSTRGNVMAAFEGMRDVMTKPGPKFVLVHSMAAHFPFAVDSRCDARRAVVPEPELSSPRARDAYADGIRCTGTQVIALVTELLQRSESPPVILLQGDHGPRGLGVPWSGDAERITPAQALERFGIFGAYYLPGAPDLLGDTVTPVNVMRSVLRHYAGADLPPLEDRSFHATGERPYRFVAIPDTVFSLPLTSALFASDGDDASAVSHP